MKAPTRLAALFILLAGTLGCSDDEPAKEAAPTDVELADSAATDDVTDAEKSAETQDTTAFVPAGKHVSTDLPEHIKKLTGTGAYLRPFAAADAFSGPAAQARTGDWIIGNADVRFAIQGNDRHAGVCPWGGNMIDAAVNTPTGWSDDNVGEYCLFFNLGRTLLPEHFEVLRDGKDGGPAILAVTGSDTLNDFLNLPSMVASFLGGADIAFPLDVEADVPVTITRYYIMAPGERVLRVITAFRNDGPKALILGTGELIDSGGMVEFFNPASSRKGFGYGGITSEPLDYLAFRGAASTHAFAPPPIDGGPGAGYLAVSGAAGIMLGADNVLSLLVGGVDKFAAHRAALHVDAGKIVTKEHLIAVGTGDIGSLSAPIWQARGVAMTAIQGKVVDDQGAPIANARISAIRAERARTQFTTDDKGVFSGQLPYAAGALWSFTGYIPGRSIVTEGTITMPASKPADPLSVTVVASATGKLVVDVTGSDGKPTPGKLTVYCAKKCPTRENTMFDTGLRSPGGGAYLADFIGTDGHLEVPVAPGDYTVVVTAGPTRTVWPASGQGEPIAVKAGGTVTLKAVVRDAVDTTGWLCGEFHIHQINSPDAPVLNRDRVRSFLAEGVDVLVPTDHDYITDMQPHIAAEKAEKRLITLPGVELTTFDYGHFNAFPLKVDKGDLAGGAVDWAGGAGPGLDPATIVKALNGIGAVAEPVVQINHPAFGYLQAIKADVLGGISHAPRARFRLTDVPPDPKTGDTGLFSEDFTAIELMTGHRKSTGLAGDSFALIANWWFALLSRGVHWTGTATSDSHRALSSQAGGPRTWVRLPAGKDTLATFDSAAFSAAVNAGKAVGSDGPFVQMWATAPDGSKARIGEVLAVSAGQMVTVTVDVQAPTWMDLTAVDLFVNPTMTAPKPGEQNLKAAPVFASATLVLDEKARKPGKDALAERWHVQATFHIKVAADGYVVAFVRGEKPMPAALFAGADVAPFAFTNPIYWDADGGGYNHPPLKKTVQAVPQPPPPPPRRNATMADILAVIRALEQQHPH